MRIIDNDAEEQSELSTWTITRTKDNKWDAIGVDNSSAAVPNDPSLDSIVHEIAAKGTGADELQYAIYPSTKTADIAYIFQITAKGNGYDASDVQGSGLKATAKTLDELVTKVETQVADPATAMLQWVQPANKVVDPDHTQKQRVDKSPIISSKADMYRRWQKPVRVIISLYGDHLTLTSKQKVILDLQLQELTSVRRGAHRISFKAAGRFYNIEFGIDGTTNDGDFNPSYLRDQVVFETIDAAKSIKSQVRENRKAYEDGGMAMEWEKALESLGIEVKKARFWFF